MSDNTIVSLVDVDKYFDSNYVIKKFNLDVHEGEFLTLLGPSGCGKTTLLRMIGGFEDSTAGAIMFEGERVEEKEPFERNVNTVFQSYALFPHMTVYDNVAYGLTVKKVPKDEIKKRVTDMLKLIQLEGFEMRKPDMMSGGQKQRVAIARALINNPKVLLLDEPLGALDLKLRKQMQIELKRLQQQLNITFIYVTHDQEEALTMSDRIAVINEGVLEQLDTPDEVYKHPRTRFVADFIGESNIIAGDITAVEGNKVHVKSPNGEFVFEGEGCKAGEPITVSIRPEVVKCSKEVVSDFTVKGTVKNKIFVGSVYKTFIKLDDGYEVKVNNFKNDKTINEGDTVYIHWDQDDAIGVRG